MRRLVTLFLLVFILTGIVQAQQMSDDQVIQYVKQAQAAGKSQKQMTTELMRRGVTQEQVLRIKKQYEASKGAANVENQPAQLRRRTVKDAQAGVDMENYKTAETADQIAIAEEAQKSNAAPEADASQIFGHNLFTNRNLTFEPSANLATPVNYRLGPGDEVIIDIWGASENTIRQVISPEGNIQVRGLGPVHLNGMTVKDANAYLQREFSKIYSGISGSDPNSQIKLTLGDIRTIQINMMGEVSVPGTYTLSAFSTVFHALYRAGGVNRIGSLRSVKVVRNGKTIADLDVYDFIMKGKMNDDIRLQEGDVILVKPYESLVQLVGNVKRPMYYEMKKTENISTLLKYAGGFTGDAYKKAVRVIRKSGAEHQVYNVDEMDYSVFRLEDGDMVTTDAVLDRFANRIEVRGAVYRPGLYQLDGQVNTVKQLIKKSEGLRGDAFLSRALIDRENEDLTHEIISVDLNGLINGTQADIPLRKNDVLYIPSKSDLREQRTLTIHGEVANPGSYLYSENMTIEDLVVQAGGLLEAAATTSVSVARRIKNPKSKEVSNVIGETYNFDLQDGLLLGHDEFKLEPFDEVFIRKSPAYYKQKNVTIAGEVLFDGVYALRKKNERISELIARAGGLTPDAYIKGARLMRTRTEEERLREEATMRLAQSNEGKDSIDVRQLNISETYSVGIDLERILANPLSEIDVVLREGDMIYVPEYVSTVKISGSVMYPNTVIYESGKPLKHYIAQAGGYGDRAKKRRVYVVHMNGTVDLVKSSSSKGIEPGCEIIVPTKPERKPFNWQGVTSVTSTLATVASLAAMIVSITK